MSRTIDISYQSENGEKETEIPMPAPYYILGSQSLSEEFWSLPQLSEIGLTRLNDRCMIYRISVREVTMKKLTQ